MKKIFLSVIIILSGWHSASGQEKIATSNKHRPEHRVFAGFNIGALAPVSLPNTIRKIESYSPHLNLSAGYGVLYPIASKWWLGATLQFDMKGMTVKDSVQYFHTLITVESGSQNGAFEGDFSGKNKTVVKNNYLTLPVYAVFQPGKNWRYNLGVYFAALLKGSFSGNVSDGYIRNGNSLGEKVQIESASFDFSDQQRKFDWGLQAGVERDLGHQFSVHAQLQWGLQPAFPSSFKGMGFNMYNIFGRLGVAYHLFR